MHRQGAREGEWGSSGQRGLQGWCYHPVGARCIITLVAAAAPAASVAYVHTHMRTYGIYAAGKSCVNQCVLAAMPPRSCPAPSLTVTSIVKVLAPLSSFPASPRAAAQLPAPGAAAPGVRAARGCGGGRHAARHHRHAAQCERAARYQGIHAGKGPPQPVGCIFACTSRSLGPTTASSCVRQCISASALLSCYCLVLLSCRPRSTRCACSSGSSTWAPAGPRPTLRIWAARQRESRWGYSHTRNTVFTSCYHAWHL